MHKALVDSSIVGLAQLTELVDQQLQQSIAVRLIEHNSHGKLVNIWEDDARTASLDTVVDNIQAMGLKGNSDGLNSKEGRLKFSTRHIHQPATMQGPVLVVRFLPACIHCPGSIDQTSFRRHP